MKHFILVLLAAVAVTACGSSRRVSTDPVLPWVGCTTQDILMRIGDPTRIDGDGKGGSVLIYESMPDDTSPDYDILNPEASSSLRRYAHFYLDDEGYCYKVDTNQSLPAPPYTSSYGVQSSIWLDVLIWAPIVLLGILL